MEWALLERASGTVSSTRRGGEGEHAVTEYEVVAEGAGRSVVRVKLHTGRKHQIRAHFAARRTPILGDPLYGPDPQPPVRLLLSATALSFDHPYTEKRLTFEIEPSKEIRSIFPDVELKPAPPPEPPPAKPRKADPDHDPDAAAEAMLDELLNDPDARGDT